MSVSLGERCARASLTSAASLSRTGTSTSLGYTSSTRAFIGGVSIAREEERITRCVGCIRMGFNVYLVPFVCPVQPLNDQVFSAFSNWFFYREFWHRSAATSDQTRSLAFSTAHEIHVKCKYVANMNVVLLTMYRLICIVSNAIFFGFLISVHLYFHPSMYFREAKNCPTSRMCHLKSVTAHCTCFCASGFRGGKRTFVPNSQPTRDFVDRGIMSTFPVSRYRSKTSGEQGRAAFLPGIFEIVVWDPNRHW